MALVELSEPKRKLLKARIIELNKSGKSLRQIARIILKEFNVKLFNDIKK
jgi:intein-encoded DNA endonuclease-like protein